MLRDGSKGNVKVACQLLRRQIAARQHVQHPAAVRIRDRMKDLICRPH